MTEGIQAVITAGDAPPGTQPLAWAEVRQGFEAEKWCWLATAGRDRHPHVDAGL